jgi:hypothetical protein
MSFFEIATETKDSSPSSSSLGRCPKPSGPPSFGACVFTPGVNCVDDNECQNGQICCPDKCNKICKDPSTASPEEEPKPYIPQPYNGGDKGKCPVVPPTFGVCAFNPDVNCKDDNECKIGQLCCNDGCNKICKDSVKSTKDEPKPYIPSNGDGQCPEAKRTFGTCVVTPLNCGGDNECKTGQLCCKDGCGRVCKDAVPPKEEKKEPEDDNTDDKCPADTTQEQTFGACSFDPKVNCVDNSKCSNGQICCSSGCNKICMNPQPKVVHEATKP